MNWVLPSSPVVALVVVITTLEVVGGGGGGVLVLELDVLDEEGELVGVVDVVSVDVGGGWVDVLVVLLLLLLVGGSGVVDVVEDEVVGGGVLDVGGGGEVEVSVGVVFAVEVSGELDEPVSRLEVSVLLLDIVNCLATCTPVKRLNLTVAF